MTDETTERMLWVTRIIKHEIKAPIGINILHNDYRAVFEFR